MNNDKHEVTQQVTIGIANKVAQQVAYRYWVVQVELLTPLTFTWHRLSPLVVLLLVHTFFTMEGDDSEFENFTLPILKEFLEAHSQNAITCCLCYRMLQFFFHELAIFWLAPKLHKDTFFPTLHPLSLIIFATAVVVAFVLLRNSGFNFHCYTQCEAMPTWKSCAKVYKGHSLMQTSFTELPNSK